LKSSRVDAGTRPNPAATLEFIRTVREWVEIVVIGPDVE
jgi:hypothetical protein